MGRERRGEFDLAIRHQRDADPVSGANPEVAQEFAFQRDLSLGGRGQFQRHGTSDLMMLQKVRRRSPYFNPVFRSSGTTSQTQIRFAVSIAAVRAKTQLIPALAATTPPVRGPVVLPMK